MEADMDMNVQRNANTFTMGYPALSWLRGPCTVIPLQPPSRTFSILSTLGSFYRLGPPPQLLLSLKTIP